MSFVIGPSLINPEEEKETKHKKQADRQEKQ